MQDSLSDAAGTGMTLTLRGKDYKVSPITIGDLAAFEGFLKSQRVKQYTDSVENPDPEVIKELMGTITDEEIQAEMSTLTGVCFLLYRALKGNNGMTLETAGTLVGMDNLAEISVTLNSLTGEPASPPEVAEVSD